MANKALNGKKVKRDGTVLRSKADIIKDHDSSNLPYPLKPIVKLDYCWRLTYTMFKHSFVISMPLTFIHFIWTKSPECWKYTFRTVPYKSFFKNYFLCVLIMNSANAAWSLAVEDYWYVFNFVRSNINFYPYIFI